MQLQRRRRPTSLLALLVRALLAPFVAIAVGYAVASASAMPPVVGAAPSESAGTALESRTAPSANVLLEQHGCWSGPAPADMAGMVPGHAVVTWPGDRGATYGGQRAVDAGIAHVFEGRFSDLTVHGFCR
jgi:hypothetical protein